MRVATCVRVQVGVGVCFVDCFVYVCFVSNGLRRRCCLLPGTGLSAEADMSVDGLLSWANEASLVSKPTRNARAIMKAIGEGRKPASHFFAQFMIVFLPGCRSFLKAPG